VIPVTVDDLAANDLLEETHSACWQRSVESLRARRDEIEGLAVATDERIEAYLLHVKGTELVALRSFVEDGGARLKHLLFRVHEQGARTLVFPKVHAAEISGEILQALGFRAVGRHRLYSARARSN
jgi:hypothetical protein